MAMNLKTTKSDKISPLFIGQSPKDVNNKTIELSSNQTKKRTNSIN